MRRAIAVAVIGFLGGVGLALGTAAPAPADVALPAPVATFAAADASSTESAFVSKINSLRSSKGLGTLTVHGELTSIGRAWAGQMASVGEISHNPNFPNQVGANWLKLGENVGRGYDVNSLFDAFVRSPAHYKNLVDPAFTHVGVGVVMSGNTIFTSHQFMQLAGAAASKPAPTAPASTAAPKAPRTPRPATPKVTAAPKPPAPKAAPVAQAPAQAPVAAEAPAPTPRPARVLMSLEQTKGLTV